VVKNGVLVKRNHLNGNMPRSTNPRNPRNPRNPINPINPRNKNLNIKHLK
jgi:hypothetical protein